MFGRVLITAVGLAGTAVLAIGACGTSGNDVAGCQELEGIRCKWAPQCGIDIGNLPVHNVSGGAADQMSQDIQACDLYYEDACIHGFVTTAKITSEEVSQCAGDLEAAGSQQDCTLIYYPQLAPHCLWLNPPDSGVGVDSGKISDAGTDGDAGPL